MVVVALSRADRKLLLATGGALVLAGLLFAAVLVFATAGNDPSHGKVGPLYIGQRRDLVKTLDEGSPLYFANPFGGRGFWLDREDRELVALDVGRPDDPGCSVRWKGRVSSYVDCHGARVTRNDLARYEVTVVSGGPQADGVLVDLRNRLPAPGATTP